MKKWQSVFLVLIITLGTFIQTGVSVVNAVGETVESEEVLSSKPVLASGDTTTTKPGETKTVYETLNIRQVTLPDGIYSIISLPKDKFKAPEQGDLTNVDTHIISSEILPEKDGYYRIKYAYNNLTTGSEISIPLKVTTLPGLEPGTEFPITDKTYDGANNTLSNGGELKLVYDATMPKLSMSGNTVEVTQNQLNSEGKLLSDKSIYFISNISNGNNFTDPREYKASFVIPAGLEFDAATAAAEEAVTPSLSHLSYDAATRVVSYIDTPDENGIHHGASRNRSIPIIVKGGSAVPNSYTIDGTLSINNEANSTFSTATAAINIVVKKVTVEMGYASKSTLVQTDPRSGSYNSMGNVKNSTAKASIWTQIYLANKRNGSPVGDTIKIDSTIKSFTDTPSAQIKMSNKFTDDVMTDSKETMTADNSIYNHAYFSITAGSISKELQAEVDNNKTVVEYTDGTSEQLSIKYSSMHSIGNTGTYFNTAKKTVKDIKVTFPQPIHLTSEDGYNLRLELYGSLKPEILNTVKSSEYSYFTFHNDLTVNTDNPTAPTNPTDDFDIATENPYTTSAEFDLIKKYPSIDANNLTFSAQTMLAGNTIDAATSFSVNYSDNLANKAIAGGQVVYLFDKPGIILDEAHLAQAKNLTNLQLINNYKNSGKTAIIGDITNGNITGDTILDYSIPITNNSALDTGRIDAETFFVFKNDLASFDLTKFEGGYKTESRYFKGSNGHESSKGERETYGLYNQTDNPDAYVHNVNSFDFKPSASLRINKWISQKGANQWVEDTNNIAKKAGEEYSYQFKISNFSLNDDFQNIDALDILPYAGDKQITNGITDPTYHSRGSQFGVNLTGPVRNIPEGYTVSYSTDAPKEAQGMTANFASTWLTSSEVTDWSKVTMIRVRADKGELLERTKSITLEYDVKTPTGIDYGKKLMSGNSIAVRGQNLVGTLQSDIESDTAILRTAGSDPVIPDETGSIRIEKADSADAAIALAGAEFTLTAADGTVHTGTTDSTGVYTFNDLPFGDYNLVETKAPAGYELDATAKKVTIDKDNARKTVSVKDKKTATEGNIRVEKVDATDSSLFLANAEFKLTAADGTTYTGTTDASGIYNFVGLPFGNYDLVETKAPTGYELNPTVKKVTINKDHLTEVIKVQDTKTGNPIIPDETGSIRVEKVNKDGSYLANAQFTLTALDGKTYTGITNANGVYIFGNLPFGTYDLVETKAPTGYKLDKTVNKVTITNTSPNKTMTIVNEKQAVEPSKPTPEEPNPGKPTPEEPDTNQNKPGEKPDKNKLPQTGEAKNQSIFISMTGWLFLLALAYPFIRRAKRNR